MNRLSQLTNCGVLALCFVLASCTSDPATFTTYSHRKGANTGSVDPTMAPKFTDALALNYANSVESIFRAKATGMRYTREASDTALAGLAAFTGASKALGYGAQTIAGLGLASTAIVQLQHIFDAKGRSVAYSEAAERIHAAIKDYVSYNLNNVSEGSLTPNGWTLANIVQSNVDMVDKVLNGHLPTAEDLVQATEPMSPKGATEQDTGTTPRNNISRITATALLPRRFEATTIPPEEKAARDRKNAEVVVQEDAQMPLVLAMRAAKRELVTKGKTIDYGAVLSAGGYEGKYGTTRDGYLLFLEKEPVVPAQIALMAAEADRQRTAP